MRDHVSHERAYRPPSPRRGTRGGNESHAADVYTAREAAGAALVPVASLRTRTKSDVHPRIVEIRP